jgi:L-fuculose-phosphate aldolase
MSVPFVEVAAREDAAAAVRLLDARGLNRGSTGNLSVRCGDAMLITPTGMGSEVCGDDFVRVFLADGRVEGTWQPSSEWHFHQAVYRARPDLNAVVHTHSPNATALACLDRPLPAFHYMIAVAGGDTVPLVPYHTFGTEALSAAVGEAMADRKACLLAHHGLVAAGATLAEAMKVCQEIESLCEVYLKALAVAEPRVLGHAEMDEVIAKFRSYGRSARRDA